MPKELDFCIYCNKSLNYDIVEDRYEFCDCEEKKKVIPITKDQVSIGDQFETDLEALIFRYTDQGLTVGAMLGAVYNRAFNLHLNLHMPAIIEMVKKNLK